jgi:hypothetical protein
MGGGAMEQLKTAKGEGGIREVARVSWKRLSAKYFGTLLMNRPSRQMVDTTAGIALREMGAYLSAIGKFNSAIKRCEGIAASGGNAGYSLAMAYVGRAKAYGKWAERMGERGNAEEREGKMFHALSDAKRAVREMESLAGNALHSWEFAYALNALGEIELKLGLASAEREFERAWAACPGYGKAKMNYRRSPVGGE